MIQTAVNTCSTGNACSISGYTLKADSQTIDWNNAANHARRIQFKQNYKQIEASNLMNTNIDQ